MYYRIFRDAGNKVIHLYLFVKTLPLDRFISLFIRLFFHGIYNFEDVFLPQCQLRRPTIQTSIKFCEFGKLSRRQFTTNKYISRKTTLLIFRQSFRRYRQICPITAPPQKLKKNRGKLFTDIQCFKFYSLYLF